MQIVRYKEASGAQCALCRRCWVPDKAVAMSAVDSDMLRWCLITIRAPQQRCAALLPFTGWNAERLQWAVPISLCWRWVQDSDHCLYLPLGCEHPLSCTGGGLLEISGFLCSEVSPQPAGLCKTLRLFKETMLLFKMHQGTGGKKPNLFWWVFHDKFLSWNTVSLWFSSLLW